MSILTVDESLAKWEELSDIPWTGMLVGNGASCAVWNRFRYTSLFEQSRSVAVADALSADAVRIFEKLQTTNFELVLSALRTTSLVIEAMQQDPATINALYTTTQKALVGAVNSVHVPWQSVPEATLQSIKAAIVPYDFVYSTNYDLLLYWAVMIGPCRIYRLLLRTKVRSQQYGNLGQGDENNVSARSSAPVPRTVRANLEAQGRELSEPTGFVRSGA